MFEEIIKVLGKNQNIGEEFLRMLGKVLIFQGNSEISKKKKFGGKGGIMNVLVNVCGNFKNFLEKFIKYLSKIYPTKLQRNSKNILKKICLWIF